MPSLRKSSKHIEDSHYLQVKHLKLFVSELLQQKAILFPFNGWEIMQDHTEFGQSL